jgi:hypothetical protein
MIRLPRNVPWTFGTAVAVLAMTAIGAPPIAWSQTQPEFLPPLIRACVAEADEGRRVDCYDREVARLIMPPERDGAGAVATAPPLPVAFRACVADADSNRRRDCYDREVARLIMPPDRAATGPVARAPTLDSAPSPARPAPAAVTTPDHFSARVTRVEAGPDQIVIHLDNGQVWEQSVSGSTDLALKNGDAVKLARQMGSWWLTNNYGGTLQVRLVR